MAIPPTLAQQRGLAFAPFPFAIISFFSSSYVIYHLLHEERDKLQRLYHRLILALNFTLLPFSLCWIWRPFAVPVGTSYNEVASGTIQTCTAQGYIYLICILAVPVYYASLSLQAFMAIKNNFKEEKYGWIEKWVHLAAICVPCVLASIVAARENFNANIGGCFLTKAPLGCELDPNMECQRGMGIRYLELVVGLGLLLLYSVFPPSVMISLYCWIGKVQKKMEGSRGMIKVRETARKRMMQNVAWQISLYLVSFWSTWVFGIITSAYRILTREKVQYNLLILAQCMYAFQGFIFAMVYFTLQRRGKSKVDIESASTMNQISAPSNSPGQKCQTTISYIREHAEIKIKSEPGVAEDDIMEEKRYDFNIFDGAPDEDSPWARFIDQDDDDDWNNNA